MNKLRGPIYKHYSDLYWKKYLDNCQVTESYKGAWELTEEWFFEMAGFNLFTSYESFKVGKHRKFKSKLKTQPTPRQENSLVTYTKPEKKKAPDDNQLKLF